ncbi:hypothetical protein HF685_07280 [Parasphingorhabdus halotolerans]|uniref:Uncharacterized protein n=1 Tax=Parasphingorhabdus halotolerans TaxID=2725558 RepID=A0A6H2DL47_9SPHN|nr:hypothetical protein HF685_07280 [Parasphingorhabdus halotolerans]
MSMNFLHKSVGTLFCAALFVAATGHAQETGKPAVVATAADAKDKKPRKITDRRHPDYIRCRSEPIIGTLAKKRRVCMTNKQWAAHIQEGNKRANELMDDFAGGMRTDVP